MNIDKSKDLFEKSCKVFPGGVNSPVRAFKAVGGTPLFIKKGIGSKIFDENENSFIDYVCSWGPCILGHSNPNVVEAIKVSVENGLTFGAPTKNELILAELIKEFIPSMEMMRMVSSGTEAVMSAVRAARGYTKRNKIIKFKGCYHGHSDGLLAKAGSGILTECIPDSIGVPESYTKNTLIAQYNDKSSVSMLFEKYRDDIAAVIVEPIAANMGLVLPKDNFLEFLRKITEENKTVLIFDEVITGFRIGLGGAQKYYNIKPDMTILGKIVGGGMPLGVYGGNKKIMENISPLGNVYQAGTLSGNPLATTAGIATINILKNQPDIYTQISKKTEKIAETIKNSIPNVCVNYIGSLLSVFFTNENVIDYNTALTSDIKRYSNYFKYLLNNGIYTASSQFEVMFISSAHTYEDIEKTCIIIKNYK